jgi:hypothetical protein
MLQRSMFAQCELNVTLTLSCYFTAVAYNVAPGMPRLLNHPMTALLPPPFIVLSLCRWPST